MAVEVIMPKAGMAMEEGTVVKWLKKEGDKVEAGEPLLEIMTDKVNMEIESPASGVLLKILKGEGEVVPVTHTIAYIGEPGEKFEEMTDAGEVKTEKVEENPIRGSEIGLQAERVIMPLPDKVAATPLARTLASQKGIDLKTVTGTGIYGEIKARDVERQQTIRTTPLAKRIAEDKNIDLSSIRGSGYGGKVKKEDILASINKSDNVQNTVELGDTPTRKPIKGMRKVIADRMLQSHLQAPPVTLNSKADVTELSALRKRLNETSDIKVSFNDFVLKAAALALREFSNINVSIDNNEIVFKKEINVGMAVALDDGLIVPVIKNADTLTLKQIAKKSKELAAKAREGRLVPDEYTGGTFTVSNLGMYGIVSFTPIINPPESAILGVCAIEDELKMVGEKIEKRSVMGLSLTFDHRVIDGAQGAIFLKKIKALLESPLELMIS